MPRLLVLHHSPTASLRALTDAVLAGTHDDEIEGVEVVALDGTSPASVAATVVSGEAGSIGVVRLITTTATPKPTITAADASAYAAESVTTRSTS